MSLALPPDLVLVLGGGLLISGLLFFYIHQGTMLRNLTAEREAAREELVQLQEINHLLGIQVEQGFSYQRLERYAREQLGMTLPSKVHYVHVRTSESR